MNNVNILLTSVGRRSYLVQYFKDALEGLGKVHVANSSEYLQHLMKRIISSYTLI
jgi:hypothetical protein